MKPRLTLVVILFFILFAALVSGCEGVKKPVARKAPTVAKPTEKPAEVKPPPMLQPVPLWKEGKVDKEVDAATAGLHGFLVLDLGEAWTPYVFTDGQKPDGTPAPNGYRPSTWTWLAESFLTTITASAPRTTST
jgi:hypothetical protein